MQYRGVPTENLIKLSKHSNAPVHPILTLWKEKAYLPTLKSVVKEQLRSHVVYKLTCPGCCRACYFSHTRRHLITLFKEHKNQQNKPERKHVDRCTVKLLQLLDIEILASTNRGTKYLLTFEALYIKEIEPGLNTEDEYHRRELTIKF